MVLFNIEHSDVSYLAVLSADSVTGKKSHAIAVL